uniref:HMG box domain-containing protein n=1 Tax=Zooxanthella nutricula TaxID=1333877 RepID=A0A7S2PP01_9DINO|mmetsp:Transcript_63298/g.193650  ORF Transcript_63298/g.193650 Transcript_63298/m.193650 type:complete len:312 (+) Transcript_63298:40-975(+)
MAPPRPPGGRTFATARRDPERPKLPATSWIRYLQHCRKEKADLKHSEVMKIAASTWKSMGESDRAPFVRPYEAEKAIYEKAFQKYKESGKLAAWKRDPAKPLKPMTGFMRFAQEVRKANPQMKMTEHTKTAGQKWKALTAQQKAPYEEPAAKEFAAWKDKMAQYKASGQAAAWKEKVGPSKAESKAEKAKAAKAKAKAKEQLAKAKEKLKAKLAKEKEAAAKQKAKEKKDKEKLAKQKALAKEKEKKKLALERARQAKAKLAEKKQAAKEKSVKDKLAKDKVAAKQKAKAKPSKATAMPTSSKAATSAPAA